MTGLEKILGEIEAAASSEAGEILSQAKEKAEGIRKAAREEAAGRTAEIEADTRRLIAELERKGESAWRLNRQRRILETKQGLIGEILGNARAKIHALPDAEYFAFLARLAAAAALPGEGVIFLGENDTKRLPRDFEATLSNLLPNGARLSVSDEARPIDGGLVIEYGDIIQNNSIGAIIDARRDEFSDLIAERFLGGFPY